MQTKHLLLLLLFHIKSIRLPKHGRALIGKQSQDLLQSLELIVIKTMVIFDTFIDGRSVLNIAGSNGTIRQQAVHLQLLSKVTNIPVPCCCRKLIVPCAEWNAIAIAHGAMGQARLLTNFFIKNKFTWLCCKQIQQLLFFYISDKVAAQWEFAVVRNCTCCYHGNHRCRKINQKWHLKDYKLGKKVTNHDA